MDTSRLCPGCGKSLAADAPHGLCQECLLKAGFATGTETGGKPPRFIPPSIEKLAAIFPQLEIVEFVGQGGMGAVYKARQRQLNRLVALKILPPGLGGDPAFAERFTREARALAYLNHPGIVTLYEFGEADGQFYFLMELVDGLNLRHLLQRGRISPREALAIVPQICDALQFAHDQGIVHRDIKPENILLDRRGRVKIADFGLAKLVGAGNEMELSGGAAVGSSGLTESGRIIGTPSYMAPEQATQPGEVDHRADIYAVGVVFYQMLTGELPGRKIEPPSRKVQMDVRLDEVVLKALEKEPERRYQHVSEVKTRVETIAASAIGPFPAPANPASTLVTFLFNPFARLTGLQSLVIGLAAMLVTGFVGSVTRTRFDGVLDSHMGTPIPLWLLLSLCFMDWLCLAVVLLIFGKVVSEMSFRAVDLFGAQALARWPMLLIGLLFLPPAVARGLETLVKKVELGVLPQINSPDTVIFLCVAIATIPPFFWMIWLMYKAYSVSCKLSVGRAVATFIPALILAEILSKMALSQLFKLI